MAAKRVNYYSWFLRVFAWDGMLPVFIVLVPLLIGFLFPNNHDAMEFAGVALPVVGFVVRLFLGIRHIHSNNCSEIVSSIQLCIFVLGIICLVLIDTMLILLHVMPAGILFATARDCIELGGVFSVYLLSMIIAMYPGRTIVPEEEKLPFLPGG